MNNVNMEKKQINVAEILKGCSKGLELYSPLCGKCVFDRLNLGTIICKKQNTQEITFTSKGYYMLPVFDDCECMIFPSKDQRDWSKFQRPFIDGDILAYSTKIGTSIFIHRNKNGEHTYKTSFYAGVNSMGMFLTYNKDTFNALNGNCDVRLATEEEKAKLFQVIKDNGYRWNSETKALEKLITPKFKVGDKIRKCGSESVYEITYSNEGEYLLDDEDISVLWDNQDEWELVCPKFNISSLKPFDRVLVRISDNNMWCSSIFSHTWEGTYFCVGILHLQCIPYEGNEHLLGTTNSCDNFYKTWKK